MNRIVTGYQVGSRAIEKQKTFTKLDFLRTKILFKALFLTAFVVSLSIFYIWSRIQIVQVGYEINDLKHQNVILLDEHKKFQVEYALMQSPQRVQNFAQEKLNMDLPQNRQIISIKP